jgi:hypothetical protein
MKTMLTHMQEFVCAVAGQPVYRALCAVAACAKDVRGPLTTHNGYVTCPTCREILEARLTGSQPVAGTLDGPQQETNQ